METITKDQYLEENLLMKDKILNLEGAISQEGLKLIRMKETFTTPAGHRFGYGVTDYRTRTIKSDLLTESVGELSFLRTEDHLGLVAAQNIAMIDGKEGPKNFFTYDVKMSFKNYNLCGSMSKAIWMGPVAISIPLRANFEFITDKDEIINYLKKERSYDYIEGADIISQLNERTAKKYLEMINEIEAPFKARSEENSGKLRIYSKS